MKRKSSFIPLIKGEVRGIPLEYSASKNMVKAFDIIGIDYAACPPGCSACEEICARERGGARIRTVPIAGNNFHGALSCQQCGQPQCVQVCPTAALAKSPGDGVIRVVEERCVGCGLCTLACPYGGIYYDEVNSKVYKCDNCDGKPKCVPACKHNALAFIRTSSICKNLGTPDIMGAGTPMCIGCGAELALRIAIRVFGDNTILFGAPGCGALGVYECHVPTVACLLTNVAPMMEGVKKYYKQLNQEMEVVAFVGDGATADVGFQSLSGAAERGEKLIYICYDNEAYMNTGIQRSGTTPPGAWTTTTPVSELVQGKKQSGKYMPLIMAMHGVPYAATASIAHVEDFIKKLEKAKALKEGMAYIHVLSPCPTGWRAGTGTAIEISRLAVETNYFPLWEYEKGTFTLTWKVENPRPVQQYTRLMGRFSHLKTKDLDALQKMVNERFALIEKLAATA